MTKTVKRTAIALLGAILAIACLLSLAACGQAKSELVTKDPFPDFTAEDFLGTPYGTEMFERHDATVINFWSNGCGSCIAEMPELEQLAQELAERDVSLVGFATSAGDGEEERAFARNVLDEKGVTYPNLIPDTGSDFYRDFIGEIPGYPTTYIVDREGNIVGSPIIGDVASQKDKLLARLDLIQG